MAKRNRGGNSGGRSAAGEAGGAFGRMAGNSFPVPAGKKGGGGLFGVSWASTLDQPLELDTAGVYFLSGDATILKYPAALIPKVAFRPVEGPQWPLTLTPEGGYTITDPKLGRILHFPAPGEQHGWSQLPLTAITDRNGNRIDLVYEAQTLTEIRHSGGYRIAVKTTETSPGVRRVTELRLLIGDQNGPAEGLGLVLVRYGYDGTGHLTEVVNSSGRPLRFTYDAAGRLTGWHDRNDHWYRYAYDEQGRGIRATGSGNFLNATLVYDPDGRKTVVTDSLGNSTIYRFNEALQVVAEIDPLGRETRSEWDRYDRLLSRTDPLGRTSRYGYDEHGNLTTITRPDGAQATLVYNELDLPVQATDLSGQVWRQEYDQRGNLTGVTDPLGTTTTYAHGERGELTAVTDPLGHTTRVKSDAGGLPVSVTDPLGATTRYAHDAFGRPSDVTDPLGGVTQLGWTTEGRPAWRVLPDGASERWSYDPEGNQVEYIDAGGQVTRTKSSLAIRRTARVRSSPRRALPT
ncbi:MAG TPA: hypothetical protein VGP70_06925 [Actinomadura sp.]|nr:hypothetical protein [Actinomadura sp.]